MPSFAEVRGRLFLTIVFAPVSAIISYFINRTLASWGILDTYAGRAGAWLLLHIPPELALNLITILIGITLYGTALGVIWYRRKGPTNPHLMVPREQNFPIMPEDKSLPNQQISAGDRSINYVAGGSIIVTNTSPPSVLHHIEDANDGPLWQAVQHVALCIGEAKDTRYFPRARAALRQKALDGNLKIRGRKQLQAGTTNFDSVYTEISHRYWAEFEIRPIATLEHTDTDIVFTGPVSGAFWHGGDQTLYADLHADQREVKRLWPEPAQRIPIVELLAANEGGNWDFVKNRDVLFRFSQELRQAAIEGRVEIWGIDLKNGWDIKSAPMIYPSEKIPYEYFKKHWIDLNQGWMHRENVYIRTSHPGQTEPRCYSDLFVDRVQALHWMSGKPSEINAPDTVTYWPIRELFFHIEPNLRDDPSTKSRELIGKDIIDKFSTGQINVWGRRIDKSSKRLALAQIPKENWEHAAFTYWFLDANDDQTLAVECRGRSVGAAPLQYCDLRVNRVEVLKMWPA
jgi:hypothetical protein